MGSLYCGRCSSGDSYKQDSRNPNPLIYEIGYNCRIGDYIIAAINYIGCTNYEGNKILVWKGLTNEEFSSLTAIDPHFTAGSKLCARFEPTKQGMDMAMWLTNNYHK